MTTLTDVGDSIRANPRPWRDIPPQQQAVAAAGLLPSAAGFSDEQRYFLLRWWLACTQADVAAINALLPAAVRVAAIDVAGALYLCGDLLTDALTPGNTYHPALPVLETLVCTYIDPPPQPSQEPQ